MPLRIAADAVFLIHFAFVLFVAGGALLVLRRPRLAWLHLPAAAWGIGIELVGGRCPLTPLENRLRWAAGLEGYEGGFVERYLVPIVYPAGLTREIQIGLGLAVLGLNGWLYWRLWRRCH